jgi:chromosome segregation ATPase
MVSRVYSGKEAPSEILSALSQTWDLAARASRLEGEVTSLTRKLEALERRGRALRAEIGRKVEDLAQEESRILCQAAAHEDDAERTEAEAELAQRNAEAARAEAKAAIQSGQVDPIVFEQAGATAALMQAKVEEAGRYRQRQNGLEKTARSLRRQIEQLRGQLSRYAEALEEDLMRGRDQVGERTREGLRFEKAFADATERLLQDLRNKPECRDLMPDLLDPAGSGPDSHSRRGPKSRDGANGNGGDGAPSRS